MFQIQVHLCSLKYDTMCVHARHLLHLSTPLFSKSNEILNFEMYTEHKTNKFIQNINYPNKFFFSCILVIYTTWFLKINSNIVKNNIIINEINYSNEN